MTLRRVADGATLIDATVLFPAAARERKSIVWRSGGTASVRTASRQSAILAADVAPVLIVGGEEGSPGPSIPASKS